MRYLVLSDIHGNNVALDAVLNTVPANRYDKILVLGDSIGDGPCPDKVLNRLKEVGAIIIAGNREELALQHFDGFAETQTALQWKFMRDSFSYLDDSLREFIKTFPSQRSLKHPYSVRTVHGSPFAVRELLYPNNPKRLLECLDSIEEPILLCGHNHCQYARLFDEKLVLNPGSVGLSQMGEPFRADYALLNITNQFSFELNHVHYSGEMIKKEYTDRNLWDNSIWGKIAYKEMSTGQIYIISFARFVFGLANERNACTHPIEDGIWLEACEKWDWSPAE